MSTETNEQWIANIQKQFNDLYEEKFGLNKEGASSIETIYALIAKAKLEFQRLLEIKNRTYEEAMGMDHAIWAFAGLVYYLEYLEKRKDGVKNS